jgi:Bardet-Biedl syndrome 9 protein
LINFLIHLYKHFEFLFADKIIIGSYHGILRIFNPKPTKVEGGWSGFRPEDVLLESSLQAPILQIEAGKFVS